MKVISTQDVLTQVIITQSDKPFGSSPVETIQPSTTDVTKTYFVTYTYFNTIQEANGNTVVTSEIATSSDVVTETFHLQTKRPELEKNEHKKPVNKDKTKGELNWICVSSSHYIFFFHFAIFQFKLHLWLDIEKEKKNKS